MLFGFGKGVTRVVLALTIILSGLMICIHVPQVTQQLSMATSTNEVFSTDEETMANAAILTHDFALGKIGRTTLAGALTSIGLDPAGLDNNMLTHLEDCTLIFTVLTTLFEVLAVASLVLLGLSAVLRGRKALGRNLLWGGVLAIIVFVLFGTWIGVDFNGFFTWMHSLFFQNGTWTFPSQSLLISMYPENFWLGMGVVWASFSCIVALVLIIAGLIIKKK